MSKPAGEIFSGHFFPRMILSFKTSLLLIIEYFNIQLSLPPDAYKYFSSSLNFNPSHDFGIVMLSSRISFFGSISKSDCVLCPLLVIAMYFFDELTAMDSGRSPRGKLWPTGVSDHPLGSVILLLTASFFCEGCE